VGRCREKNSQCRMTDVGVSVWQFLHFFKENNTFLDIFRLKFVLKNIFLISSITVYKTVNNLKTEHFFS